MLAINATKHSVLRAERTSRAFYNELDPRAAAWLRELERRGLIAPGDVDERSIAELAPADLAGYTQVHLFAGIGGWSRALRLAGIPDSFPVWTGSCPCQPFSQAGRGAGVADSRHLWPEMFRLARELAPPVLFGEQVASPLGRAWLDTVCADLESAGYACGAADLAAASVGAPHRRQRLYWVADRAESGRQGSAGGACDAGYDAREFERFRTTGVAHPYHSRPQGRELLGAARCGDGRGKCVAGADGVNGGLGHTDVRQPNQHTLLRAESLHSDEAGGRSQADFWSGVAFLPCRDGRARPAQPGIFPLVDGLPRGVVRGRDPSESFNADATPEARIMRLCGYGNAIVPQVAAEFVSAWVEARRASLNETKLFA